MYKLNYNLFLVFFFVLSITYSQEEKPINKTVTKLFIEAYNTDDYTSIFDMFSPDMQKALPLDNTTAFFSNLKSQSGKIVMSDFTNYVKGTFASYKTTFESATLRVNISATNALKINGIYVEPYIEKAVINPAIDNLTKEDNLLTEKQVDLLYNNTKDFPNKTQLSIAIIKNGQVSYYGIKRHSDTLITTTNYNNAFEIGSISKVFTSTLLSRFVKDKKVVLDDPISKYINVPLKDNAEITFKALSNHTSGLSRLPSNFNVANTENPYKTYTNKELEHYLTQSLEIDSERKGSYQYSNLGAGLIGYTLSKIENRSFPKLLQDYIFSKYNMTASTTDYKTVGNTLVKGLNAEGNEVPNWEFSALAGAGAIVSNVQDLSKFAMAQFDPSNEELELTRQKTLERKGNIDLGLGWHIIEGKSGDHYYWHNGGTGGYTSSMIVDIKRKNAIIILSNVSAFNENMKNIDTLCFGLIASLKTK